MWHQREEVEAARRPSHAALTIEAADEDRAASTIQALWRRFNHHTGGALWSNEKLRRTFHLIDVDGDGQIDNIELGYG